MTYQAKSPLENRFLWFFSKGLRFRILLTLEYQATYLQVSNLHSAILGDFFLIRFQSHQAVERLAYCCFDCTTKNALVIFLELENIRFKLPESVQTIQISGCILCTVNFKALEFSKIKDQKVSCCCGQLTNGKMLKRLKLKSLNIVHCVNRE